MDFIHYKVRKDGRILSRAAYIVLGATPDVYKDILSITVRTDDVSTFIVSLYKDGRYRPTTIGSSLSGPRRFLSGNGRTTHFRLEIPMHLPREMKIMEVYNAKEPAAIESLLSSGMLPKRDTAVCRLLLETGLRGINACSLRLKDIDWEKDTVSIIQNKSLSMLRAGIPRSDISAALGHREPNIVSVYLSTGARSLAACTLPIPPVRKGGVWERLLKPWFRTKRASRDFLKIFRILPEAFITPPRFRANSADISLPVGTLMRTLSRLEGSVSQHQSSRISLPREIASFFKECDRMSEEPRLKGRHIVFPAMFRLLYCCGLRCKEARTLARKDVHLNLMTSNTVASYRASLNIRIGFLEDVKGGPRERVDYL